MLAKAATPRAPSQIDATLADVDLHITRTIPHGPFSCSLAGASEEEMAQRAG